MDIDQTSELFVCYRGVHFEGQEADVRLSGSVSVQAVPHPSLTGNALGDPLERDIPIYHPPGFDPNTRYPVVYYLPGYTGSSLSPLNISAFEPNLVERFERAVV